MRSGGNSHKRVGDASAGQGEEGSIAVKRVQLTRKTRPGNAHSPGQNQGFQRQSDGKG